MMYAQYRLLGRFAVIPTLLPLFWAVVWPIMMLTDPEMAAPAPAEGALWLAAVAIPATIAVILAYSRADVAGAMWSFTLPGLQRGWLASNLLTALALAIAAAAAMAAVAGPASAAAAFSLCLASYAILAIAFNTAFPGAMRLAGAGLVAVAIWKSWEFGRFAAESAMAVSPILSIAAVVLLAIGFSRRSARANLFAWSTAADTTRSARLYWERRKPDSFTWSRPMATARVIPHVHAALHVATGGKRVLAVHLLWNAAYGILAYRLLGSAWWIAFSAGIALLTLDAVPRSQHLPIGRNLRARVGYTTGLVLLAGYTVAVLLLLPLGEFVPWGVFGEMPRMDNLVSAIGAMFALAPIVQWGPVQWGIMRVGQAQSGMIGPMLLFFIYILAVQALTVVAGMDRWGVQPWASLKLTLPLAMVTHAALWYAVQRYYASADLAPAP